MRPTPIQNDVIRIRNEFGTVELVPVTGILPIAQLSSALPAAQMHRFDLDTAERIALITENRGVQICCPMHWRGQAFLILHDGPSAGAVCRVSVVEWLSDEDPIEVLSRESRTRIGASMGI